LGRLTDKARDRAPATAGIGAVEECHPGVDLGHDDDAVRAGDPDHLRIAAAGSASTASTRSVRQRSNVASANCRAVAVPSTNVTGTGSAEPRRRDSSIICALLSRPTALPFGPIASATRHVSVPVPQPMSSTGQPVAELQLVGDDLFDPDLAGDRGPGVEEADEVVRAVVVDGAERGVVGVAAAVSMLGMVVPPRRDAPPVTTQRTPAQVTRA